ncbi:hypothetical protein [Pseudomonas sp. LP_7_YM]|uniref:hypothetical protein n=1 Tax=Pseudomonas sp. LP_7_YM TaxID=2485137 RepID=UPI00105DB3BF|nr:hypothetical protein [Pseudomonas sp. LP_7_YM]TDV70248.1 hypothetical protein EC915_102513 [Pseudomonas sp. LP_7_YM]
MKRSIAFGFALSILAAGSAFASSARHDQRAVADAATALNGQASSKGVVTPFHSKVSGTVIVAENRKEFGSGYQRY